MSVLNNPVVVAVDTECDEDKLTSLAVSGYPRMTDEVYKKNPEEGPCEH